MIRFIINLYIYIIILDALLSYVPQYQKYEWAKKVKQLADFSLKPVRELLPKGLPMDFSPLVVILLLQILVSLW